MMDANKRGNKIKRISVRLDNEMNNYLEKCCKQSGIKNKSVIIRNIIIAAMKGNTVNIRSHEDYKLTKELISEINKIGVNINQIVKDVNQHYYSDYEKSKLFALLQKIIDIVLHIK